MINNLPDILNKLLHKPILTIADSKQASHQDVTIYMSVSEKKLNLRSLESDPACRVEYQFKDVAFSYQGVPITRFYTPESPRVYRRLYYLKG